MNTVEATLQNTAVNTMTSALMLLANFDEQYCTERAINFLEKRINQNGVIDSPAAVKTYLRLQLAKEQNEIFAILFLDNKMRPLAFEKLFYGTVNQASVFPRVIMQRALAHNAAGVVLTHNHPNGGLEPSTSDQYITQQLKIALTLIDVRIYDHIIVSSEGYSSFIELGLL